MQLFDCGLSNVLICTPLVPFGIGLVYFRAKMVAVLRIGFSSNQIRSYIHATKDIQLVANRYFIGYFGQLAPD